MARQARAARGSRGRPRHTTARLHELPPTVSIDEAGEMLGISRRSAYRAAARGEIPTLRLGRRLLVPTPRLLALLGADHADGAGGPTAPQPDGLARRVSPPEKEAVAP
jgi:excisionase family DNA binding protein